MDFEWIKHLARLYLPVYQYESDTMRIAYAGYSSIKKNYYVRLVLEWNNNHTFLGRRLYWQIPDLIRSKNLDMVISEISPVVMNQFQNLDGYIIPEWARMKINIDRSISDICSKSATDFRDVKRRIRKYNLSYEMINRADSFEYFKKKFYLPYISKRHGKEAWIEDLNVIGNSASQLMAIKENEDIVGEVLIRKTDDSLYLMLMGLLDGNEEHRRHGVIGAIYYFGIIEGQKQGCRYLDVGGSRPFLTDGLTKYKKGLGAEFISHLSPKNTYLWLGVNEHSSVAMEFMKKHPVMHINKDFSLKRSGT